MLIDPRYRTRVSLALPTRKLHSSAGSVARKPSTELALPNTIVSVAIPHIFLSRIRTEHITPKSKYPWGTFSLPLPFSLSLLFDLTNFPERYFVLRNHMLMQRGTNNRDNNNSVARYPARQLGTRLSGRSGVPMSLSIEPRNPSITASPPVDRHPLRAAIQRSRSTGQQSRIREEPLITVGQRTTIPTTIETTRLHLVVENLVVETLGHRSSVTDSSIDRSK